MQFTVKQGSNGQWEVRNPRGKVVHKAERKSEAESVARQAALLSGEKVEGETA